MFMRMKEWLNEKKRNGKKQKNAQHSILIVSANEQERRNLQQILEREGYRLLFAENGEEGLNITDRQRPSLILLDMEIRAMSGIEMCRRVKESQITCHIPVIFLTESNTPRSILECFEVDAENYLTKPVNRKSLVLQVAAILEEFSAKQNSLA